MNIKSLKKRWLLLPVAVLMIVITVMVGCGGNSAGTVTEAGSTTVQPLAEKLAAAFEQEHSSVSVVIQGGGTSVGIKSVNDGTVNIGAASRELTPDDPPLVKHLLARDGIAIVTGPNNSITELTKAQVRDIFGGIVTNWKDIGGSNHEISVIVREEGSGTRTAFQDLVMAGVEIVNTAIQLPSNGAIKTAVAGDAYAIGFISMGYLDTSIKALAIDGVAATEENAKNGTYPIVRPLYFLTKEQPTGLVKNFIDFCLSSEGQAVVAQEGYISVI
jgi:phosphate transport system substrate-binding protein